MNSRFAEACGMQPLDLSAVEQRIQNASIEDGRSEKDRLLSCDKDIYIGVFFDGTNNKYRDTPSFSQTNVARLYEVFPGTPAAQAPPALLPRVLPDGSTAPRSLFPDRPFKPESVASDDFPYYRKIYVPGLGAPMPNVGDSGVGGARLIMKMIRAAALLLALLPMLLLSACEPAAESRTGASGKGSAGFVSVTTDSVNYMHERSVQYTLYDLSQSPPRAIGGAIVDRLGTGGEKGCCVGLPKTWRPGLTLRLVWHESDQVKSFEDTTRDLEVPRYDTPADLWVVFYPEHEVELVVSAAEPGHADWRGRIKQTPWEQCVATYTRKPCFAALPKQFDTGSRGYCFRADRDKRDNAADDCAFLMHQCLVDFEDEPFCKDLLWDSRKQ